MPTRDRIQRAQDADEILDLRAAGLRVERTLLWRSDDPPPLFKYRGRWHVRAGDLDDWLARREGAGA
jgi:hypothetical protein